MLTIKQKMTLEAIEWYINKYSISPTYRELSKVLKCDVSAVFKRVFILEEKGYIKTQNGRARTIQVLRGVDE